MTATPTNTIAEPVRQMLADDRSLGGLGIQVLSAMSGTAEASMTVTPDGANGHGIAHGGLVYTLADTTFACAVNSLAPGSATADASIVYVSPAHVGEVLVAQAEVRYAGERQSLVDVTVRCGKRVVAEYRGRSARLRNAPRA
jgi:acyl-CoA thioesterase